MENDSLLGSSPAHVGLPSRRARLDASATGTFEGTVEWVDPVVGGAVVLRRVVSMPKDGYKHMKADAMLVEGRGGRKPTLMTSTQCLDRIVDEHRLALHT